jgi:DNA-binding IclR family transcriptional regulator
MVADRKETNSTAKGARSSVRVLDKAVEILDALSTRKELSVAEIADAMSEPRSTIYRLIASLQGHGFVDSANRRATYRLGPRLLELGGIVQSRFDVREAAAPIMEALHDEIEETIFLCIRRRDEAVCIERLDGLGVQSLALRLGGAMPLHTGGAPKAILAFEAEAERDRYISEIYQPTLKRSQHKDIGALREELEDARKVGYVISDEDVTIGIAAIGAPVFDHQGRVCAGLSVSGARALILGEGPQPLADKVIAGAAEASAAMGYQSSGAVEVGA